MRCCFCKKEITFAEGHSAFPIKVGGICCKECDDMIVIPIREEQIRNGTFIGGTTFHSNPFTKEKIIDRLNRFGYTTIHIFGNLYLVRHYSKFDKKFSLYIPKIIKE